MNKLSVCVCMYKWINHLIVKIMFESTRTAYTQALRTIN